MRMRTVLLFGQSLLIGLVANSLEQCPPLCVSQARNWTEASVLLADQVPDALIFDLAGEGESHVLPLLLRKPELLLIGLDPEHNQAVLLSGQESQSLTLGQIREMVETGSGWRRSQ